MKLKAYVDSKFTIWYHKIDENDYAKIVISGDPKSVAINYAKQIMEDKHMKSLKVFVNEVDEDRVWIFEVKAIKETVIKYEAERML